MNTSLRFLGPTLVLLTVVLPCSAGDIPRELAAANVSMIGLIAKTHAVRVPTTGGFGKTLEFTFTRFLERDVAGQELTIRYKYTWDTALPEDLGQGSELFEEQSLTFAAPTAADRARGYQTSLVKLQVAESATSLREVSHVAERRGTLGRHFGVSLLPSPTGKYVVVDENGRLVRELNRRYAERSAECFLYEGCVIACLPNDRPSLVERHAVDAQDLDQFAMGTAFARNRGPASPKLPTPLVREHTRDHDAPHRPRQVPDGDRRHAPLRR